MSPEAMRAHIDMLNATNASLQKEVGALRAEILLLTQRLEWFRRQIYGQKRERYLPNDQQVMLELGIQAPPTPPVVETHVDAHTRRGTKPHNAGHGRDQLPAHLPRVQKHIAADYDTTGMQHLRDTVTEELHYKEPEFYVLQIIRPVHVKIEESGNRSLLSPALPARCIEKGNAGASMVAQTIITKIVDHTALYHFQKQIQRICGYVVPYATLNDWFARGVFWLEPIALRLHQMVIESGYVQMDETTLGVLTESKKGKSHKGYMVVCNSPERKIVSFQYFNTRNQKIVGELLGQDFKGMVQTDGLDIYDFLTTLPAIIHAGCHAHARRGFEEARGSDGARAAVALDIWQQLFAVEKEAADRHLCAEQRLVLRTERSLPLIEKLKSWMDATIVELPPKSLIAKAIAYTLNRWEELTQFLSDGRIELSNNKIENRIRPHAQGRKNWLFSKSVAGAHTLAVAQTVLRTCELHGINPFDYLCDVLEKIPTRKANDIDDLLPTNWQPSSK